MHAAGGGPKCGGCPKGGGEKPGGGVGGVKSAGRGGGLLDSNNAFRASQHAFTAESLAASLQNGGGPCGCGNGGGALKKLSQINLISMNPCAFPCAI